LTYTKVMPVANVAHGVGLGLGWLVGMAAFDVRRRALWCAAAGFGSLVILSTLVACPWHPLFRFVRGNGLWWVQRMF
jgi:NO-binding membrane sensor protein with MHYT domain